MNELSILWVFDNILIAFGGLKDILRFALASKQHLKAYCDGVKPSLRVLLSDVLLHSDSSIMMLSLENIVLDCASSYPDCWKVAAKFGCPHLMRLLQQHGVHGCDISVLHACIQKDSQACIEHIRKFHPHLFNATSAECAAECGNLEVLACILDCLSDCDCAHERAALSAFKAASQRGNTQIMQWLYDAVGARCDETVLKAATDRNQSGSVVWIFENVADAKVSWLKHKDDRAKVRRWLWHCSSMETHPADDVYNGIRYLSRSNPLT